MGMCQYCQKRVATQICQTCHENGCHDCINEHYTKHQVEKSRATCLWLIEQLCDADVRHNNYLAFDVAARTSPEQLERLFKFGTKEGN